MNYRKLFSITILHDYFSNNLYGGFRLVPTPRTHNHLLGHKLIVKESEFGLTILIGISDTGNNLPFLSIDNGTMFEFEMILKDNHFSSFTDLITLENLNSPILEEDEQEILVYPSNSAPNGGTLIATKQASQDKNLVSWAKISIDYQDFLGMDSPPDFNIQYEASESLWRYFLLLNSSDSIPSYSVLDGNASPFITFDNPVDITSDPTLGGPIGIQLMEKFGNVKGMMIQSSSQIKYQQNAHKNIRLINSGNVLIHHMPNPSYLNAGNTIIHLAT